MFIKEFRVVAESEKPEGFMDGFLASLYDSLHYMNTYTHYASLIYIFFLQRKYFDDGSSLFAKKRSCCGAKCSSFIFIFSECHEDVVKIVNMCVRYGVACIPFGGGTSVSRAACCPPDERRTIISLDMSQMNRILWTDKESLLICCESGIIGQDLERELRLRGFTCGHEPDSYEFSR